MLPGDGLRSRVLLTSEGAGAQFDSLSIAPDGSFVTAANGLGSVVVAPLGGGPARQLGLVDDFVTATAVGPGRHLVAAGTAAGMRKQGLVRVWDPTTGDVRVLDAGDGAAIGGLRFAGEGQLIVWSGEKHRRWDLTAQPPRILDETDLSEAALGGRLKDLTRDDREVLLSAQRRLWIRDLSSGATREVGWVNEGAGCWVKLDPTGGLVLSRNPRGVIGVASAHCGEPHLLLGQRGLGPVVVSPDGRWIAAGDTDGTIRLWPMPDLSRPPLHTLPHEELLAKLRSLTNLRAVRDPGSPTGWKIEVGPFPGWETVPEW